MTDGFPDDGLTEVVATAPEAPGAPDMAQRANARRTAAIRFVLVGGYLVVVFGILLPKVIDYRDVLAAFRATPPQWLAAVGLLGLGVWVSEGLSIKALLPELGVFRATVTFLAMSAVGSTVPGPVKMAFAYRLFRGWGVPPDRAVLGLTLNGLAQQASKLILPALAAVLLTVTGVIPGWGFLVAIAISIPVALGSLVSIWVLRSEAFARRVGGYATRATDAVARRIRRPEPGDLTDRLMDFREAARGMLVARAIPTIASQLLARTMGFFLLLASLRAMQVTDEILPVSIVLAGYAMVMAITLLPIAPGGAGLPELLYIAFFTSYVADPAWDDAIAAGVMLFRGISWFLPIPVGYLALWVERQREKRRPTPTSAPEGSTA